MNLSPERHPQRLDQLKLQVDDDLQKRLTHHPAYTFVIPQSFSTQPGHPSAGKQNEYWRWLRPSPGKKRRVLHNSRPCYHGCWHTDPVRYLADLGCMLAYLGLTLAGSKCWKGDELPRNGPCCRCEIFFLNRGPVASLGARRPSPRGHEQSRNRLDVGSDFRPAVSKTEPNKCKGPRQKRPRASFTLVVTLFAILDIYSEYMLNLLVFIYCEVMAASFLLW